MVTILKLYAKIVRKYLNRPKTIKKMHAVLNRGYEEFLENKNKNIFEFEGKRYKIIKFKTIIFKKGDNLVKYMKELLSDKLEKNDIITIAESILGITQGRAYPVEQIIPSKWAYFIYPWISNVTYGTGIGMPETMECAIREIGVKRMLKATIFGAFDRITNKHGSFYKITGPLVKSIDYKKNHPVPYKNSHNYIVLSPSDPFGFCKKLFEETNHSTAVIDANNLSVEILGLFPPNSRMENLLMKAMKGNPAGQDDERRPIIVIREIKE